jgi:hypothetical protein
MSQSHQLDLLTEDKGELKLKLAAIKLSKIPLFIAQRISVLAFVSSHT